MYLYANLDEVEPEAIQQLITLANSPLPVGYVSAIVHQIRLDWSTVTVRWRIV